jgi:hypothetical protein
MGTPMTMLSARWKREANSLIFSHVAVSTGVIDSPETPLYLASIAPRRTREVALAKYPTYQR